MSLSKIPLAGVIGSPIAHSRSPRLHGHWLETYGIAGHYIPMDVSADDLSDVLKTLPRMGFAGVNITIPHKEAVMALADVITDRARQIGAANTLTFLDDGTFEADNTDGYGFIENLRAGAPDWNPDAGPAAVLGAGGAARAVIASLLDAGVRKIFLANRTRARAERLAADFGSTISVLDWAEAGNMLQDAELVVNTTSMGMVGKDALNVPLGALRPGMVVTDLVYTPLRTPLLETAERKGCVTVDGLGMLLHQAVPGFERWFGQRPEVDRTTRAAVLA